MERKESFSTTTPQEKFSRQARANPSRLEVHDEQTLGQASESDALAPEFHANDIQARSMSENGRSQQRGPFVKSQAEGSGLPESAAPRESQPQRTKECETGENPTVKKSHTFPLKRRPSRDLLASGLHPLNEQCARIESENEELRKQLSEYMLAFSSSKESLAESKARVHELRERLEEATATLYRIRPQRQEHTESEIHGDFNRLSESIKNWIEKNCDDFLEDDQHGFEIMSNRFIDGNPGMKAIIKRFQLKAQDLVDLKEHIIAAVVMRYLFDGILNRPLSILLNEKEEELLEEIYKSMAATNPPKGNLPTRRTWRADTVTAIDSHPGFASRYREIEDRQTTELYTCVQSILPKDHNSADAISSIAEGIAAPAMSLAQKMQTASSIWELKYSAWSEYRPGELLARIPNFLAIIDDYRCINLSACGKQLKPATDLATADQQRNLTYVLDIFPGLYCQRMTVAGLQPRITVSKPVLIVSFVPGVSRHHMHSPNTAMKTDRQKVVSSLSSLQSHCSDDSDGRVAKESQAFARSVPRSQAADNSDDRLAKNPQKTGGSQKQSQSSRYQKEAKDSPEIVRHDQRQQPSHPAPQGENYIGGFFKKLF